MTTRTPVQRARRNDCARARRKLAPLDARHLTLLALLKKYRALSVGSMFPIAIHFGRLGSKPTGNTIASLELRGYVAKVPVMLGDVQVTTMVVLTPKGDTFAATLPELEAGGPNSTHNPYAYGLNVETP